MKCPITLKQAIDVLGLEDWERVHLCHKHREFFAPSYSVMEIREKFDMQKVEVHRIEPFHYLYEESLNWEFVVRCD